MSKPSAPEYAAISAQRALLQAIDGGDDWHTQIGRAVRLRPDNDTEPTDHIALVGWRSEPNSINDAMLYCDWQAIVVIDADTDLRAALVLADMRAALTCSSDKIRLVDVTVTSREAGSNYAAVGVSTAMHTPTR